MPTARARHRRARLRYACQSHRRRMAAASRRPTRADRDYLAAILAG
ncbi:hypothetical protein [Micromonospora tulbaghiae]